MHLRNKTKAGELDIQPVVLSEFVKQQWSHCQLLELIHVNLQPLSIIALGVAASIK